MIARSVRIQATALLVMSLVTISGAALAETEKNTLAIVTPSVTLSSSDDVYQGQVIFTISGNTAVNLTVDLMDVWSSSDGSRVTLPAGSTPLTGQKRLRTELSKTEYVPSGEAQDVVVTVWTSSEELLDTPLSSAVKLTLTPKQAADQAGSVEIISSAVAFVFATHENFSVSLSKFAPQITTSSFVVSYLAEAENASVKSRRFIEDGLIRATFTTSNQGSLFAYVSQSLTIRRAGFWVDPLAKDSVVFSKDFDEYILNPGQVRGREIALVEQLDGSDQIASLVANWGIYELILKTSHHTGQDLASESYESLTIYVFPIRQMSFLLIGAGVVLLLLFRVRLGPPRKFFRKLDSSIGEFLYAMQTSVKNLVELKRRFGSMFSNASSPSLLVRGKPADENSRSIRQILESSPELGKLSYLLEAAGLLDSLAAPGEITLLAPNDEAFQRLPPGVFEALLLKRHLPLLKDVIDQHICSAELHDAKILSTATATNGLIHRVDKVLVPKGLDLGKLTRGSVAKS